MKKTYSNYFRVVLCVLLALILVFSLSACGGSKDSGASAASSGAKSEAETADKTPSGEQAASDASSKEQAAGNTDTQTIDRVVIGVAGELGVIRPGLSNNSKMAMYGIWDILFDYDPVTGGTYSDVFESMTWTDDTTLVCKMYDNIYFSDGTKATSEDALYSILVNFDDEWGANPALMAATRLIPEECHTIDDLTVEFKLSAPNCFFLQFGGMLMSKAWVEKVGFDSDEWFHPVTSGRYYIDEFVQGSHFIMKARDDYWNKNETPVIKEYEVRVYPDATVMYMDFEIGNVDICSVSSTDYDRYLKDGGEGFTLVPKTTGQINHFTFGYQSVEAFSDKRVREALAIGIDWEQIGKSVYGSLYKWTNTLVSTDSDEYLSLPKREYDPDKAIALLKEAGYGPGDLQLQALEMDGTKDANEAFQAQAALIGVDVQVEFAETGAAVAKWLEGVRLDYRIYNDPGVVPALTIYQPLQNHMNNTSPIKVYYIPTSVEPRLEELYGNTTSPDDATRIKASQEIQQIMYDEFLTVPVSEVLGVLGYSDKLPGSVVETYAVAANVYLTGRMGFSSAWK